MGIRRSARSSTSSAQRPVSWRPCADRAPAPRSTPSRLTPRDEAGVSIGRAQHLARCDDDRPAVTRAIGGGGLAIEALVLTEPGVEPGLIERARNAEADGRTHCALVEVEGAVCALLRCVFFAHHHVLRVGDERDPIACLDVRQGISADECYFGATLSHILGAIALDKCDSIQ